MLYRRSRVLTLDCRCVSFILSEDISACCSMCYGIYSIYTCDASLHTYNPGWDEELTSRSLRKRPHTKQKYRKYSDSTAQAPSSPDQEAAAAPHSHQFSDVQVEAVH